MTLHDDNIVRLWNTNDGRCISGSQKKMLKQKGQTIKPLKTHPGNIIVIGEHKDICIVNVYKMMVIKTFEMEIHGSIGVYH